MAKMPVIKIILASIMVLGMTLGNGCGSSGGGGDTTGPVITGTYVEAPNPVATLAVAQSVYSFPSTAANVSMTLPVDSSTAVNYLLTVANTAPLENRISQNVTLYPETTFSGAIRQSAELSANVAEPSFVDPEMLRSMAAKGQLEAKLRQDFIDSMRQNAGNIRAGRSLRASNHSGEVLNNDYDISLIGDSLGYSYSYRKCKLVRISAHCKIFVDLGEYNGLSAVSGAYAVSEADLDHFIYEFETHIYTLMNQSYGLVYDIDQDGKLSILISPVYTAFGYAGLFNSIDMTPGATITINGQKVASNQRDMIGLWSPNSGKWDASKSGDWREATRETIAHEMQHATNFSAKVYPGGVAVADASNSDALLEEVWLDEGLSVGSEARYRILRGDPAGEARFNEWARSPFSVSMKDFSYTANAFAHYGQKGLFNFYLYEQYGSAKIKSLVQTTKIGLANFASVFGTGVSDIGVFDTLVRQWQFAATNEGLRTAGLIDINKVTGKYRYQAALSLVSNYKPMQFDSVYPSTVSVAPGATAYYLVKQPKGTLNSEYKFRIESTEGQPIEINMMRLP